MSSRRGCIDDFPALVAARVKLAVASGQPYAQQVAHMADRPGHDRRYAIDALKIERELGPKPSETFETCILEVVRRYLDNLEWVADVQIGACREWVAKQYEGVAV